MTARGIEGERGHVLARKLDEIRPHGLPLQRDAREIAGRILHARDVLQFEQPLHGVDRHVDHRAGRDVVDDDRNADRVVHRLEMLVHAFLGRLVVIGRDHEHGVGAGLLGMAREFDGLGGRVGARARDHRNAAARLIDAPFDHLVVLVMRQGGALAGGADRNQTVGTFGNLPFDQVAETLFVELAVLERGHQRGEGAAELAV